MHNDHLHLVVWVRCFFLKDKIDIHQWGKRDGDNAQYRFVPIRNSHDCNYTERKIA